MFLSLWFAYHFHKTIPATAKTAKFDQKIAKSIPATAKTAKSTFPVARRSAIVSIAAIPATPVRE